MALAGTLVHNAAHMIPDFRRGLPLIDETWSRAFKYEPGIDRDHILGHLVDIQKDFARGYLLRSCRLTAGAWTFDENRSGGSQASL